MEILQIFLGLNIVVGFWLIFSPWVLSQQGTSIEVRMNVMLCGILVVAFTLNVIIHIAILRYFKSLWKNHHARAPELLNMFNIRWKFKQAKAWIP